MVVAQFETRQEDHAHLARDLNSRSLNGFKQYNTFHVTINVVKRTASVYYLNQDKTVNSITATRSDEHREIVGFSI